MAILDLTKIFTISRPKAQIEIEVEAISDMQKGESYTAFGKRMCMLTNGNVLTLRTILQRIYHYEKSRQLNDENLQHQRREAIIKEIEKKDVEISDAQTQKKSCQKEVENFETEISELKQKRLEATNKNGQENKMAKLKLILGCIILVVLTVYLFVFYSSTFFSAFFKDFGTGDFSVGEAMFDSQTIPKAFEAGLGELIFILSAPIIFMGLGFALHFFQYRKALQNISKL